MHFCNKLERLSLVSSSNLGKCLWARSGTYTTMEHLKGDFLGTPLLGRLLALPTNILLGWKGLPGANTRLLRKFVTYVRKKYYHSQALFNAVGKMSS